MAASETETVRAPARADGGIEHLDTQVSGADPTPEPVHALTRGRTLGRYVILGLLGRGGMGTVYSAFDPDLDRRVAIKILRFSTAGRDPAAAHARLLREAQVMGKLRHPHLVSVYDVGRYHDAVFVAMELIDGQTVREWCKTHRGGAHRAEVVRIFIAAGEGLAAAHDAGVVHRDFKPDNMMIARDGRVVVLDFGLAAPPSASDSDGPGGESSGASVGDLTMTGEILGTPAYMSPEQMLGLKVDAASDQFSYCVALYEALLGERPFRGSSLDTLRSNVIHGRIERESQDWRDVPRWLRSVLERGLSREPADRFATMHELVAALREAPARRRRRLVGAAGVVLLATATIAAVQTRADPCDGADAAMVSTWDAARRADVETALAAQPVPYAAEAATHATATLSEYAAMWAEHRSAACRANQVDRVQTDDLYARRLMCLDDRLFAFDAMAEGLKSADARTLASLPTLLASLPDISMCGDERYLLAAVRPPDDPAVAAEVDAIRRELRSLLERSRRLPAGQLVPEGEALTERARAAGYEPLIGDALLYQLWLRSGKPDEDEGRHAIAFQAWVLGEKSGNDRTVFDALIELARLGRSADRPQEAEEKLALAEAVLHRIGEPLPLRILVLQERAGLAMSRLDHAGALAALERIVELRKEDGSEDSVYMLNQVVRLAEVDLHLGRVAEAREALAQGFSLAERYVGPSHPMMAMLHILSARLNEADADPEATLTSVRRAEALLDPKDQHNRVLLRQLEATALASLGRIEAAEIMQRAAFELARDALGESHIMTAIHAANLGNFLMDRRRYEEATPYLEQALGRFREKIGEDEPATRGTAASLGEARREAGRREEAEALYTAALAGDAADDGSTIRALTGRALLALDDGRADEAVTMLERALAIDTGRDIDGLHARAQLVLARALEATGGSGPRALELARSAAASLDALRTQPELQGEAHAWLETHDPAAAG